MHRMRRNDIEGMARRVDSAQSLRAYSPKNSNSSYVITTPFAITSSPAQPPTATSTRSVPMVGPAVAECDVQTLLRITDDLTRMADSAEQLDEVVAHIHVLIPFEKCVLFHEWAAEPHAGTSIYEFSCSSDGPCTRTFEGRQSLCIEHYLASLHRTATLRNAFFWSSLSSDSQVQGALQPASERRGVAGCFKSVDAKMGGSATLIQLQCAGKSSAEEHLLFANFIVLYLHLCFVRWGRDFNSWSARHNLTSKEKEVLQWVVEGKTSWEIGKILSVSERTVKFHLRNIYSKLNVTNRTQAVTMASRCG